MPHQRLNRLRPPALLLALALFVPAARADEDDTRFLLHQQSRQAAERMAGPEDGLLLQAPPGALLYEGQVHTVPSTVQALEPAIYIAINTGQWERLAEFVSRYRLLQGHRPALAQMALAIAMAAIVYGLWRFRSTFDVSVLVLAGVGLATLAERSRLG